MIKLEYTCDAEGCDSRVVIPMASEWIFNGLPIKHTYPRGWKIRTPKGKGLAAAAYCPEHADGSFRSGDRRIKSLAEA